MSKLDELQERMAAVVREAKGARIGEKQQYAHDSMSAEEATRRGYRRVSIKHNTVSRVDTPRWRERMGLRPGTDAYLRASADQYRRVYSKDTLVLTPEECKKVPTSSHDSTGFVPEPLDRLVSRSRSFALSESSADEWKGQIPTFLAGGLLPVSEAVGSVNGSVFAFWIGDRDPASHEIKETMRRFVDDQDVVGVRIIRDLPLDVHSGIKRQWLEQREREGAMESDSSGNENSVEVVPVRARMRM